MFKKEAQTLSLLSKQITIHHEKYFLDPTLNSLHELRLITRITEKEYHYYAITTTGQKVLDSYLLIEEYNKKRAEKTLLSRAKLFILSFLNKE